MALADPKQKVHEDKCFGVELHVHLDGALTVETVFEAALRREHKILDECKSSTELIPKIQITDVGTLETFLQKMWTYLPIISGDVKAIRDMALAFCERQYKSQIYYTETRYCPHILCDNANGDDLSVSEVVKTIQTALNEGSKQYGIIVKSILCCLWNWKGDKKCDEILQLCIDNKDNGVVGIDIAGSEGESTYKEHKDLFTKAHKAGVGITVHAGEASGCGWEYVWHAITELKADRIGHGYHIFDKCADHPNKQKLMQLLGEKRVHLEGCPISSVITGAVDYLHKKDLDWTTHPIVKYNQLNLNWSISTDDPGVLGCSYGEELMIAEEKMKIPRRDIAKSIIAAAQSSFLADGERQKLVKEVTQRVEEFYLSDGISDNKSMHKPVSG